MFYLKILHKLAKQQYSKTLQPHRFYKISFKGFISSVNCKKFRL